MRRSPASCSRRSMALRSLTLGDAMSNPAEDRDRSRKSTLCGTDCSHPEQAPENRPSNYVPRQLPLVWHRAVLNKARNASGYGLPSTHLRAARQSIGFEPFQISPHRVDGESIADETLPPESLPRSEGNGAVAVCSGPPCSGDGPCYWCLTVLPGADIDDLNIYPWKPAKPGAH